jgi:hypothetical protein
MAGFNTKTFSKHDDYMTPKTAWSNINHLIPKNKIIWEAFYGDGKSGKYLEELGHKVIHEKIDFFKNDLGEIIITNIPFSMKKEVLTRLKELGKPFILIMPTATLITQYVRTLFSKTTDKLQIIIPRKRIQFTKIQNGKEIIENKCNFDCYYFCWKMNLPRDIIWLN